MHNYYMNGKPNFFSEALYKYLLDFRYATTFNKNDAPAAGSKGWQSTLIYLRYTNEIVCLLR